MSTGLDVTQQPARDFAGFDDGHPGENPNYGWNRASVQSRSRRGMKPPVTPSDLIMPNGLGTPRMLATCVAMAGIISALYVWIPLIFLNVFVPISGLTYSHTLVLAFVGLTLFLYLGGSRETRRDRDLAARL
jgi:hypothetical protein